MIIRDDRPLTDRERAFIEALFRLSFKEVADRVQQGASPQEAVVGVVNDILSRKVITLSPNLYKRWCSSLLSFAEQQATGVKGTHSLVPVFHTPVVLGNDRNTDKDTRIKYEERTSGMSVIGGSGTGKTTLLIQVALADITNGHAVLFIDVDGDSINELLPRIPIHRMRDVILLDLSDTKRYIGLNPLAGIKTSTDADRYMQVFKRLWHIGPETPNLENTLRASLLTLSYCGLTVAEMPLLLRDEAFRKQCIAHIPSSLSDDWLRWYWEEDYEKLYKQLRTEPASSTLNKVLQLLTMKQVAYAVSQSNTLNLRKLIDERKIILLRLSLQDLGEDAVRVLGTFLMAELKNALFSRIDVDVSQRNFVSLIADEAQLYVNADFYEILTRGRKYGIGPSLATQTLTRLDPELRGILDQLNIHVSFRVGTDDAAKLAHYYAPKPKKEFKEVKQEKRLPTNNPFDWLVSGHTHSNPVVNTFADQTLRKIHLVLEKAKEVRAEFNSLLYRAMTSRDPLSVLCEQSSISFLMRLSEYYPFGSPYFIRALSAPTTEIRTRSYLYSSYSTVSMSSHYPNSRRGRYGGGYQPISIPHYVYAPEFTAISTNYTLDSSMLSAFTAMVKARDDTQFRQAAAQLASIAEKKWRIELETYKEAYKERYDTGDRTPLDPPDKKTELWEQELQRWLTEERPTFETFLKAYRDFVLALAAAPLLTTFSGDYEKEKVKVGRKTTAETVNKTAQQLLNLKNKRAYVSIGSRGKKYKPRVKTMPLPEIEEEAKERLLHARKTQAIENAKKYTTAIEDIEIQYRERRLAFIHGGRPQGQVQEAVTEEPSHTSNTPIKETPPASVRIAKRRVASFTPIQVSHAPGPKAYKLTDTDILYCLYQFRHLTIDQLARAVQRESSKNNVRTIVNTRLIRQGLVSSSSPGGRSAYVYSLTKKGKKALEAEKGTLPDMADTGYSTHLHNVNNLLIPAILLPQVEPSIRLLDWQHAEAFKVSPITIGNNRTVVPDGFVSYVLSPPFGKDGEPVGIIFEWDEGTESLTQLRDKLLRYITFASGPYQDTFHLDTLTIAFLASETERVARMKTLAEEVTKARKDYADLFLFAALNTAETDPLTLLTTPLFHQPFDTNLHALMEPGA